MKFSLPALLVLGAFVCGNLVADEAPAKKDPLKDLSCPISGKAVVAESKTAWKDGSIYFCCTNCPKAFAKNTDKHAAKANAQLVSSGQYKQKACPITGRKLNPDTATEVAKVSVAYCCNGCKKKVNKAEGADKVALIFSDAAFEKGFEKAE